MNVYRDVKKAIKMCQQELNNKCEDSILEWLVSDNSFSQISQCYQFTNEAIDQYYKLLNLKDKNVLTVCGSGDQVIYAMIQDAQHIDVFDTNRLTYYYLFLKLSAIMNLNYSEFLDFMNLYSPKNNQLKYYKQIRDAIVHEDVKIFWDLFFQEQIHLFPALFMGQHNDLGVKEKGWALYLEKAKIIVSYLNEEHFYHIQNRLNVSNSTIQFKQADLLKVTKYFNNNYDFINCSNIINYIDNNEVIMKFFKEIIERNLNQDGLILLNYYWNIFNETESERLKELFTIINPDIYTFLIKDTYPQSILTYKKHL